MNTVVKELNSANDDYYLTPKKAGEKRRIASVRARNAANARVFLVDGKGMTVKQIALELHASPGAVSKEIKLLRKRGIRRFGLEDFSFKAANDDGDIDEGNNVPTADAYAGERPAQV